LCMSTSSSVATYGHAMRAVYTATKYAVKGMTEALGMEFERFGIRTADVLPGCIDTPMLRSAMAARTGQPFDASLFDSMPKEGPYRLMPVSAIAEAVWNAYHSDVVHWYVPEEVGDTDRLKAADFNAARDETRDFLFGRRG
jgi:NAD(P)-dependent dehydrogenase (short-subunit alcohol dehydrogenase family)